MNWIWIRRASWHGFSQSIITGGAILLALNHWPSQWEWLVIGVSSVIAFVKGVDGYRVEPA